MNRDSIDEAFHAVLSNMPPGWHFKGLYLTTRERGRAKPGVWYAQATGPDPWRPGTGFGVTESGGIGETGIAPALRKLAGRLEDICLDFEAADEEARGVVPVPASVHAVVARPRIEPSRDTGPW